MTDSAQNFLRTMEEHDRQAQQEWDRICEKYGLGRFTHHVEAPPPVNCKCTLVTPADAPQGGERP